ncbi:MAG: zinc dependent phospholipase C family protein [Nitrospirota bacterium]
MILFPLVLLVSVLFVPSEALAWGPLTHIYLGNELLALGSLIPAGIFEIIRRYRKDFIYGNIMADIVVGKKYLPEHKNSHNWDVAFELFRACRTRQQKAFVYGYISHLAADTVAHNIYTADKRNFGHTLFELKADCIIDKKYWFLAREIDRKTQVRNDLFLENSLDSFIFSFRTNKRILNSMVFLSVFNQERVGDFIDRNLITSLPSREAIEALHEESLDKIIDLFRNWEKSGVLKENPNGISLRRRLMKKQLTAYLLKSYRKRMFQNIRYNL